MASSQHAHVLAQAHQRQRPTSGRNRFHQKGLVQPLESGFYSHSHERQRPERCTGWQDHLPALPAIQTQRVTRLVRTSRTPDPPARRPSEARIQTQHSRQMNCHRTPARPVHPTDSHRESAVCAGKYAF